MLTSNAMLWLFVDLKKWPHQLILIKYLSLIAVHVLAKIHLHNTPTITFYKFREESDTDHALDDGTSRWVYKA